MVFFRGGSRQSLRGLSLMFMLYTVCLCPVRAILLLYFIALISLTTTLVYFFAKTKVLH